MNKFIIASKTLAVMVMSLGGCTFLQLFPLITEGLGCLTKANLNAVVYMSLMYGVFFILTGLLLVIFLTKIKKFP